jgi:lipid-binding SYLF domain-containing protein
MEIRPSMNFKSSLAMILMMAIALGFTGCAVEEKVSREAHASLSKLVNQSPAAALLATKAKGVLVFPDVLKGGFIFSGTEGDGALIQNGETTGFYNIAGMSYGLLAGAQMYSYAIFFMTDEDLEYLNQSGGFELGAGPSIVVINSGIAGSLTTTTMRKGVYSFFYNQQGLMGALDVQGAKITKMHR